MSDEVVKFMAQSGIPSLYRDQAIKMNDSAVSLAYKELRLSDLYGPRDGVIVQGDAAGFYLIARYLIAIDKKTPFIISLSRLIEWVTTGMVTHYTEEQEKRLANASHLFITGMSHDGYRQSPFTSSVAWQVEQFIEDEVNDGRTVSLHFKEEVHKCHWWSRDFLVFMQNRCVVFDKEGRVLEKK